MGVVEAGACSGSGHLFVSLVVPGMMRRLRRSFCVPLPVQWLGQLLHVVSLQERAVLQLEFQEMRISVCLHGPMSGNGGPNHTPKRNRDACCGFLCSTCSLHCI